jgi:hypothetical protein
MLINLEANLYYIDEFTIKASLIKKYSWVKTDSEGSVDLGKPAATFGCLIAVSQDGVWNFLIWERQASTELDPLVWNRSGMVLMNTGA